MPTWSEIILRVQAEHAETVQAIALMAAPYGIYVEDYRDLERDVQEITHASLIDQTLLEKERSLVLVHIYLSPQDHPAEAAAWLEARCAAEGIHAESETQPCRSEDWENNWKAYFHPLPVGEKLLIQPAWEPPADPQGRAVLLLEPGLAFGSGSHATTRLCMQALENTVTPGCAVLDIGCGSGILSVAALLLGAGHALGVDIDPMAVENARENAARNGFDEPVLRFVQGDLAHGVHGQFDVIVSNIVADAVAALSSQIAPHLAPGGVWISSGIIDSSEAQVLQALETHGFRLLARHEEEGWVCLAAGRNE